MSVWDRNTFLFNCKISGQLSMRAVWTVFGCLLCAIHHIWFVLLDSRSTKHGRDYSTVLNYIIYIITVYAQEATHAVSDLRPVGAKGSNVSIETPELLTTHNTIYGQVSKQYIFCLAWTSKES
jgi:hypothetical protein